MNTVPAATGSRRQNVLLVDDHQVFTDVLAFALNAQPDLRCVAVAHSARDALAKATTHPFDVAIVDLHLPDGDGLSVLGELQAVRPHAKLVVLTGHPCAELAVEAQRAGADAFLAKDGALQTVLGAIRGAPEPSESRAPALTPREREVLAMLTNGADVRQIARDLELSVHTVRDYIKTLLAKFGVHSQHGVVAAATRLGVVL